MNCLYCECGATTLHSSERKEYVALGEIYRELEDFFSRHPDPDFLTFSGNGEPTLHLGLGEVISFLKQRRPAVPVAVLTNGSLLGDPAVRKDLHRADLVMPSLDAATDAALARINRPSGGLTAGAYTGGLLQFAREFNGRIWMEVLILPGYNDDAENLEEIKRILHQVQPERVQLNTLDRPGIISGLKGAGRPELEGIADFLELPAVEIIASFKDKHERQDKGAGEEAADPGAAIMEAVSRRPCTLEDLRTMLGAKRTVLEALLEQLIAEGQVVSSTEERGIFYHTPRKN